MTGVVAMPCGHVVPRDPVRADWCSECERLEALENESPVRGKQMTHTTRFAALTLALLAAACGGADFTAGNSGGDTSVTEPDGHVPAATGGTAGAVAATGGSPATGGSGGASGGAAGASGGSPATGGALGSTGGTQGTGGAPETGGAAGGGGLCGPDLVCPDPSTCAHQIGLCCVGPEDAPTACGCRYNTGHANMPIGCRTGVGQ